MRGKHRYVLAFFPIVTAILSIACLCHSCVLWPPPTSSEITPADLAGTYIYKYEGKTITVLLNADGTFEIVGSPSFSGTGTWEVDEEAKIVLKYQEPSAYTVIPGWYVTGGILGGGFSIIGGEGDPDTWNGLIPVLVSTPTADP